MLEMMLPVDLAFVIVGPYSSRDEKVIGPNFRHYR